MTGSNGSRAPTAPLHQGHDGESYYVHDGDDDGEEDNRHLLLRRHRRHQPRHQLPGSISLGITAVDDTPPVEVNDSATVAEGATSSNLNVLSNDTDSPDNGTLGVYSVGGATFASLTDSSNLHPTPRRTDTRQVAGSYGTLYIKSDGTSYYIHDGDDDGGLTETFSYVATDGTSPRNTSCAGNHLPQHHRR